VFSEIFIADETDKVWGKGSAYFTDDLPGKKAKLAVLGLLYSNAGLISGLLNVGGGDLFAV